MGEATGSIVAIIPARNARSVVATVRSVLATGRVDRCVVVDDGSTDDTASRARDAGADVLVLPVNWGKGDAIRFAVERFDDASIYLLVDADLGETAVHTVRLLDPVLQGTADIAIASFPPAEGRGGFGVVKRAAGWAVRRTSGYDAIEPLSGQRAIRGPVLRELVLAPRFGLEVAMTVDAVRAGHRLVELPLPVDHEHTGRTWRGFAHRGGQAIDIVRGLVGRIGSPRSRRITFALVTAAVIVGAAVPAWQRDRTGAALGGGSPGPHPIVLITVTNTSLADLDRGVLPNISRLMASTGGALTPRISTGPEDQLSAFASLGAGAPVTMTRPRAPLGPIAPTGPVPDVGLAIGHDGSGHVTTSASAARRTNAFGALGALGDALHHGGAATAYVGARSDGVDRSPAALAVADSTGRVDRVELGRMPNVPGRAADALAADRSAAVSRALETTDVVIVDAGGSQEPWSSADGRMSDAVKAARHERRLDQVRVADALVGRIVADHPEVLVVVAGVSPASHWRLTPLAASGAGTGALWSPSTREPGLSVLTDLAPTVLAAAHVDVPHSMVGQRLSAGPARSDLGAVRDLHLRTVRREGLTAALTVTFILVHALVYAAALIGLALRGRRRSAPPITSSVGRRVLAVTERLALSCAALPVVTFLYRLAPTPWQRPAIAAAAIALGSIALAAVALRFRRHPLSPLILIAAVTVATMGLDAATSGAFQNLSLLGYTPLTAARYYGMGNLGFAVFGSAAILLAGAWVASSPVRRDGLFAAGCLFTAVIALQVAPVMGADFGSALVLVPTAVLALVAWSGHRITARSIATSVAATVATVGFLALIDGVFAGGTHIGRFLTSGPAAMWAVVHRKLDSNLHVLTTSAWSWLLLIVGGFALGAIVVAGRRTRWFDSAPLWRTTLLTMAGFGALGGLANDSGVAIPTMACVYIGAMMLLIAGRTPFERPIQLQ